jgi:uncharacterized membrane protein YoaK (UPF0700 family)
MPHRLPAWVEFGAFFLSLSAGAVNAIALLGFNHQGVSHLSGISTQIGIDISNADFGAAFHLAAMVVSFALGASISGVVIGSEPLKLGRGYTVCLFGEAALLSGAMWMLSGGMAAGHFVAAAACGLQNAMTSTFSGAVVRTTHVTGIITDLGVSLGLWIRGESTGQRRLGIYIVLVSGFIAGGIAGAFGFIWLGFAALLLPAAVILLLGASSMFLPSASFSDAR